MNILLSGSTGLIGTALSQHLLSLGHTVYPLFRNPSSTKPHYWIPKDNLIHLDTDIKLDAVIHLAGENIADSRWNQKKKNHILNSRIKGTQLLAETVAQLAHKPKLFVSGSAIGFYGETGSNIIYEGSPKGTNFLSDVASQWEAATEAVEDTGIRTVHLRTGIVLSPNGGALKKMLPPFSMGLGGVIGNGQQYMSWVSINDCVDAITTILNNKQMSGAYNIVSPNAVTNKDFTKALGKALHRPTIFPLPALIARILFGEMADALLLSSCRVLPNRLQSEGHVFKDTDLNKTLTHLLSQNH